MRNRVIARGRLSAVQSRRSLTKICMAGAAALAASCCTKQARAAYYVGWNGGSGNSWFNQANWTGEPGTHDYDIPYFSNTNGNYYVSIDQPTSLCEGIYIGGGTPGLANNWVIDGPDALNLQEYSITTNDGYYGNGVVFLNDQGHGVDLISAPVNYGYTADNTSFLIAQDNTTNTFTISGLITGGGLPMAVQGAGSTLLTGGTSGVTTLTANQTATLTLAGANNYAGLAVVANAGTLVLGVTGAGNHAIDVGGLTINSGALVQLAPGGNGDQIADTAPVIIASGAAFDLNGQTETVGSLNIAGTGINGNGVILHSGTGSATLNAASTTLSGDSTIGVANAAATLTLNAHISGSSALTKAGLGTLILAGSNSYTGATTLGAGTLSVTGSLPASGTVNVPVGILAGTGSVGNVALNGGALHPGLSGADGSIGTLTVGSLAESSGDLRIDLAGSSADKVVDTGAVSFTGGTISISLDAPPTASTYTILTAAGGITGTPTLAASSIGRTNFGLSVSGNSLILNVSGSPASLVWGKLSGATGDGTTWDAVQSNKNWNNAGVADTFYNNDSVTFSDANNNFNTVNIIGQVAPSSVTFTNSTRNYTVTGTGGITGTASVYFNGTGAVTLMTSNTYTGNTNISAGTVVLGTGGSIASQTINLAGGTLNFSGGSISASTNLVDNAVVNLTSAAAISEGLIGTGTVNLNGNALSLGLTGIVTTPIVNGTGAGSLNVTGGAAILTAANTYTGGTTIQSGASLQIGNGGATGSLSPTTAISNNGTLIYNLSGPTTIASAISSSGAVVFNSAGNLSVTGAVTGAGVLLQSGAGTTSLNSSLTGFTGEFNVGGGALQFNFSSPTTIPNTVNSTGQGSIQNVGKLTFGGPQNFTGSTLNYNVVSVSGNLADGVPADVELTGALTSTATNTSISKTGVGTLAISGSADNTGLGIAVGAGTVLLNKTSSSSVHAVGAGGLIVNNGGTAKITGTGGAQFNPTVGTITVNEGGKLDLNGKSDQAFNLVLGSTTNGSGATLANTAPGTASVIIVGGQTISAGGGPAGTLQMLGYANAYAAAGSSLEIQADGVGPAPGSTNILTANGPGTVLLTGPIDDVSMAAAVTSGTLILAHASSGAAHAISTITGVSAGATLQLGGSGGDQIYDGYAGGTGVDWGVLNMNGTFDLNGQSEGIDKLTGSGNVINSQTGTQVTLTLGVIGDIGPTPSNFTGSIKGNIAITKVGAGNATLSGSNTFTGPTMVNQGSLTISSKAGLPVATPSTGFYGTDLTIGGAGMVIVSQQTPAVAVQVNSLNLTGALDINNNAVDVNAGSASLSTTVLDIQYGYNNGTWNGPSGIFSSTAAANTSHLTAVGAIQNDNGSGRALYGANGTIAATFYGVTPQVDDVLIKYTYYGDANLDGKVDGSDYSRIDTAYRNNFNSSNTQLTGWYNGDFNYDGVIDGSDYTLMDNAFNQQGAMLATAVATAQIGSPAVPEPASLGLIGAVAATLLGRRRRQR